MRALNQLTCTPIVTSTDIVSNPRQQYTRAVDASVYTHSPTHLGVGHRVEFTAQGFDEWRWRGGVAVAIDVGHGEVHHACMAPHATRVEGDPVGQHPQLRGHRVQACGMIMRSELGHGLPGVSAEAAGRTAPSHEYTPSVESQNFPQEGTPTAPPLSRIKRRAATATGSSAGSCESAHMYNGQTPMQRGVQC